MEEDELPDGLWEADGRYFFECNCCEQATEWPDEPKWFKLGKHENLCGRTPWCCP